MKSEFSFATEAESWAVIFLSGDFTPGSYVDDILAHAAYLAAADGGLNHLYRLDKAPDLLVGDMDSVAPEALAWAKARHVKQEQFPRDKDATDGELVIRRILDKGYTRILVAGALGTDRFDHMLGNIHFLLNLQAEFNLDLLITDGVQFIVPFSGKVHKTLRISEWLPDVAIEAIRVSVIPVTDVEGLTYEGLKYPLEDAELPAGSTRAISNELATRGEFAICMTSGKMLLVISIESLS